LELISGMTVGTTNISSSDKSSFIFCKLATVFDK
jgi:hypothetical protein